MDQKGKGRTAKAAVSGKSSKNNVRLDQKSIVDSERKWEVEFKEAASGLRHGSHLLRDLSASGPVHLLLSDESAGLLIHHAAHPGSVSLQSMTTGQGFSLSRCAARLLAKHLAAWAGPAPKATVSEWKSDGDSWTLAE